MKLRNRVVLVALVAAAAPAFAASIPVPNGNFTNTANNGSVGGLIGTGTNVAIGSGPWNGTYNGVLSLLLSPNLDIDDVSTGGTATISNVAGINVLGNLLDTSGWFQQDLGSSNTYLPNTVYTLGANIDGDTLLTAQLLDSFGAGIALMNGSNVLASSADPSQLLFVGLLSTGVPDEYRLTLSFTTGATAPTGDIGIRLFDNPSGLATVNLLSSVTFSDVTLDASPAGGTTQGGSATPEPSECFLTGIVMIGLASVWKRMQRKRAAAALGIV